MPDPTDMMILLSENGGLGGPPGNRLIESDQLHAVWDMVKMSEMVDGEYEYRLIYIVNASPINQTLEDVKCWIAQSTASPYTEIEMARGLAGINQNEAAIPDENSAPSGSLNWTHGTSELDNITAGVLRAGDYKSIWLRRQALPNVPSGRSFPFDNYILLFRCNRDPGEPGPSAPTGPTPLPTSANDRFGVRMLLSSSTAADAATDWFIEPQTPESDERFDPGVGVAPQVNGDGSFRHPNETVRMAVTTSNVDGVNKDVLRVWDPDTVDYSALASRGYWYHNKDWKNVEITGYFKIANAGQVANGGAEGIGMRVRNLRHNSTTFEGCTSPYYEMRLYDDGTIQAVKRMYFASPAGACGSGHSIMPFEAARTVAVGQNTGSLRGKFVGIKTLVWNFLFNGTIPPDWTWYDPVSDGQPAAGDPAYQNWIIFYDETAEAQFWYIQVKDSPNSYWFGEFFNYANAVKYLEYLRDNVLPVGPGVHMETWLDLNANNSWRLHYVFDDAGLWYPGADDMTLTNCQGGERCGGEFDQTITWGSPFVVFKWLDYPAGGVHFKNLSVREIVRPWSTYRFIPVIGSVPRPGPTPPAPPPPGPSQPPPPPPSPAPAVDKDPFGVRKIYKTKSGGWESFIKLTSSFEIDGELSNPPKNQWGNEMTTIPTNTEWHVGQGAGLEWARCTGNGVLKYRGRSTRWFCYDRNDVKRSQNCEFTFYAKLISFGQFPNYSVSAKWWSPRLRSNEHMIQEAGDEGCECNGRGLTAGMHFGRDEIRINREIAGHFGTQFEGNEDADLKVTDYWQRKFGQSTMPLNRTIGYKYIVRNIATGSKIRHEIWIDPNNTGVDWEMVKRYDESPPSKWVVPTDERAEWDDTNQVWNDNNCRDEFLFQAGTYDTMPYTEGGCAYLRTNNVFEADLSRMSLREIDPLP